MTLSPPGIQEAGRCLSQKQVSPVTGHGLCGFSGLHGLMLSGVLLVYLKKVMLP